MDLSPASEIGRPFAPVSTLQWPLGLIERIVSESLETISRLSR